MVLCRLYEQVYHSFVVTEQERGLKDLRQPTKVVRTRQSYFGVKLTIRTGCICARMWRVGKRGCQWTWTFQNED